MNEEEVVDLLVCIELMLHPKSHDQHVLAEAHGQSGFKFRVGQDLKCLKVAVKGASEWKNFMTAARIAYSEGMERLEGALGDAWSGLLTEDQVRELKRGEERGVLAGSRPQGLLNEEWGHFREMDRRLAMATEKGRGKECLVMFGRFLQRLQQARTRHSQSRLLALYQCHLLRVQFVDKSKCLNWEVMYESGMIGSEGGMTKEEVQRVAEAAARKALGSGNGGGGQTGGGSRGSGGAAGWEGVREVEVLLNGDPIKKRDGKPWVGPTCRYCRDRGRWCGHSPSDCALKKSHGVPQDECPAPAAGGADSSSN